MNVDAVTPALIALLVPAALGALARAGGLARARPGELRYSRALRWIGVLLAVLPPLAMAAAILFAQKRPLRPDERLPVVLLFVFAPVLMAPVVLELVRVRHSYDEVGFDFRSPWSRHRHVAWSDVASLRWRKVMKSLDLRSSGGTTLHISPLLGGLEPFAELALARIPPAVLAGCPDCRAVLRVMAAGAAGDLLTSPLTPEQLLTTVRPRGGRTL
jgi:hypothetical protein